MSPTAPQITGVSIVYSTVCSGADKKKSNLRVPGLYDRNTPVTGEFPAHRASNVIMTHWNRNDSVTKISSVASPKVVIMTTYGETTGENCVKMTFPFQLVYFRPFQYVRLLSYNTFSWDTTKQFIFWLGPLGNRYILCLVQFTRLQEVMMFMKTARKSSEVQ